MTVRLCLASISTMTMRVLIPLPSTDFDPTETAIPWSILKQNGIPVCFSTPDGVLAHCDQRMLSGKGLGFLAPLLIADRNGRNAYQEMALSTEFQNPLKWSDVCAENFAGLILPGGHAPGMKEYLESPILQKTVSDFFAANKPVGAICHGVVLAARSRGADGRSVLAGRKSTALLASQEFTAWGMTALWLGNYYRTYKQSVQAEVTAALGKKKNFISGSMPLMRDQPENLRAGFTVLDENYLSARWPGDAHRFSQDFVALLKGSGQYPKPLSS